MNKKVDDEQDVDIPKESGKTEEEDNSIEEFDHSKPLDPRAEMMSQMVSNSKEEREKSHAEFLEAHGMESDADPINQEEDEEELDEPDEETIDNSGEKSENKKAEEAEPRKIRVKVNGEEKEISEEEAQEIIQKNLNADLRTQEAIDLAKRYEQLISEAEPQQKDSTPPDDDDAVDIEEALNKALNKVYDGDIEDAAAELAQIVGRPQKSEPKPQALSKQEIAEVVNEVQDHKTLTQAFTRFKNDENFKHITKDPVLMDRVNAFTEDLQRDPEFTKTNPSYDDYFAKAAEMTNEWITEITGVAPKISSEDIDEEDERLTNKRQLPKPPSPRTVRRGRKHDENKFAKSNTDIIRELAEKRGQTNL